MAPRDEGSDLTRIQAFTDGVFAVAITLLVLALDVPQGDHDLTERLLDQLPDLFAYFLTFAVVGRLWIVHHRFFATLERFDGRLMAMNLLYLSFVVLIPFTTELLGDHGDDSVAPAIYATVLCAASTVNLLMIRHALRCNHVRSERVEDTQPFASRLALMMPIVFGLSVPVAFVHPHAAEAMWILLLVRPGLKRRGR